MKVIPRGEEASTATLTMIYNRGHWFPIWVRVPTLVVSLFSFWFSFNLLSYGLTGWSPMDLSNSSGSPLMAAGAMFVIGAMWLVPWFAQMHVFFDPQACAMIVCRRGFFRMSHEPISFVNAREIILELVPGRGGRGGKGGRVQIDVRTPDGRQEHVGWLPQLSEREFERFTTGLRQAAPKPVTVAGSST